MRLYKMMNVAALICVLLGTLAVESAGSMSAAIEVMIWWYGFAAALRGMAYIGAKHEEEANYKEWKESTKKHEEIPNQATILENKRSEVAEGQCCR